MEEVTLEQLKLLYDTIISYSIKIDKTNGRRLITLKLYKKYITKQYAKILMEIKYGRILGRDETVDHIDRNKLNDTYSNLIILDRATHASLDSLRVKVSDCVCPECSAVFTPTRNQRNSKKNKAGPFCSKSCTGKYGAKIQKGEKALTRNEVKKEYYKVEK